MLHMVDQASLSAEGSLACRATPLVDSLFVRNVNQLMPVSAGDLKEALVTVSARVSFLLIMNFPYMADPTVPLRKHFVTLVTGELSLSRPLPGTGYPVEGRYWNLSGWLRFLWLVQGCN